MFQKIRVFVFSCFVFTLFVSGCSAAHESQPKSATFEWVLSEAKKSGSPREVAMLEDKVLTSAELQQSIDDMYGCFRKQGIWYEHQGTNPVDGWRPIYAVSMKRPELTNACVNKNFLYIELGYELLNEAVMDPALMASVQTCLTKKGIPITGKEKNTHDLVPRGSKDEKRVSAVMSCFNSIDDVRWREGMGINF